MMLDKAFRPHFGAVIEHKTNYTKWLQIGRAMTVFLFTAVFRALITKDMHPPSPIAVICISAGAHNTTALNCNKGSADVVKANDPVCCWLLLLILLFIYFNMFSQ